MPRTMALLSSIDIWSSSPIESHGGPSYPIRLKLEARSGNSFVEWTRDGLRHHPEFIGVRDAKSPREVRRENG